MTREIEHKYIVCLSDGNTIFGVYDTKELAKEACEKAEEKYGFLVKFRDMPDLRTTLCEHYDGTLTWSIYCYLTNRWGTQE